MTRMGGLTREEEGRGPEKGQVLLRGKSIVKTNAGSWEDHSDIACKDLRSVHDCDRPNTKGFGCSPLNIN